MADLDAAELAHIFVMQCTAIEVEQGVGVTTGNSAEKQFAGHAQVNGEELAAIELDDNELAAPVDAADAASAVQPGVVVRDRSDLGSSVEAAVARRAAEDAAASLVARLAARCVARVAVAVVVRCADRDALLFLDRRAAARGAGLRQW